jgi:hypothetical protein
MTGQPSYSPPQPAYAPPARPRKRRRNKYHL